MLYLHKPIQVYLSRAISSQHILIVLIAEKKELFALTHSSYLRSIWPDVIERR